MSRTDLERLVELARVVRDPWFVVDGKRTIQTHNPAFAELFPEEDGTDLTGRRCYDLLQLTICKDDCIALSALRRGDTATLDAVEGCVAGTGAPVTLQATATPVTDVGELRVAALVAYRDQTERAREHGRFEQLYDEEAALRLELEEQLSRRTRELLEANDEANRLELELAAVRKGLEE